MIFKYYTGYFLFFKDTFNSCNMIWPDPQNVWSTAFILYTATVGFFGPLLIICLCYLLIVVKVGNVLRIPGS